MSWLPKSNIVVPIDFSDDSKTALQTALELADTPAAVHLLHVLYPLDSVSPGVVWGEVDDTKREAAVKKQFDKLLQAAGVTGVETLVRFGNPGIEISDYAKKTSADLIVIPARGRHGLERLLLGSTAERVLRHAKCPVLVLHRTDAD